MVIKSKSKKTPLLEEGTYPSAVNSFKGQPSEDNPKKILAGFKIENHDQEVIKELSPSFEPGSPLRNDVETILGRELTAKEAEDGIDLNTLKDKPCQVTVYHKAVTGGRLGLAVSLVLPASTK